VCALVLVLAATAAAADVPRATLAKQADAICKAEDVKRAEVSAAAPQFSNPAKATVKQLRAAAPWFVHARAIFANEVTRIFALGTPREPAARVAWIRLRVVLTKIVLPEFTSATAAAQRGDQKTFATQFTKLSKYGPEELRLQKTIGLKICGSNG
jgi:hypothetical protein